MKFNVAGVTTNPGFAKTYQSGYASLINSKDLPVIEPLQTRGVYELNEPLLVNDQITDLKVIEIIATMLPVNHALWDCTERFQTGTAIWNEVKS